jgi:transposase
MMGTQATPERLFYDFCLEDHVPDCHLLRRIDRFLDLGDVRQKLRPFYCSIGRPSIDPELMIRMLIVGYCFAIRSERRLCEEVHLNLAYRWFCRLGLDGQVPDHSTFSRNRHGRFRQSNILRHLFEMVVRRCMAEGLVGGEGFAVDASLIQADASARCRAMSGASRIFRREPPRPSETIWPPSMMRPSALPAMWCRSSSQRQIRQPSGQARCAGRPSSPMPPTI